MGACLQFREAQFIIMLAESMATIRHGAGECIWELHPDPQTERGLGLAWDFETSKPTTPVTHSSHKATTNPLISIGEFHSWVTKH